MSNSGDVWDAVDASVDELEKYLELPTDFLNRLRGEDDWSFVIKVHVLIEATVAHTISSMLGRPKLDDWVARLPLNGRNGKMELLARISPVSKFDRSFVDGVSSIRNDLVHDVKNASFQFDEYLDSLHANRRNALGRKLNYAYVNDETGQQDIARFESNPKRVIWDGLRLFLAILNERARTFEFEQEAVKIQVELAKMHRDAT